MNIINPATAEIITTLVEDNDASIALKYSQSTTAQPAWACVSLLERIEILKRFSALLAQNLEVNAGILTSEVGKPLQQARNEINGACARITWLTQNAEKYLSDELASVSEGMTEKIVYEALGVVCNISAWNYPFLVGVNVAGIPLEPRAQPVNVPKSAEQTVRAVFNEPISAAAPAARVRDV